MTALIIAAVLGVCLGIVVWAYLTAEWGWQDADGYHAGKDPGP